MTLKTIWESLINFDLSNALSLIGALIFINAPVLIFVYIITKIFEIIETKYTGNVNKIYLVICRTVIILIAITLYYLTIFYWIELFKNIIN